MKLFIFLYFIVLQIDKVRSDNVTVYTTLDNGTVASSLYWIP